MARIRLSRLTELLAENRGDLRLTNEDLAQKLCEGLGLHHDSDDRHLTLRGDTPIVVAKELRTVQISPRLLEAFSMPHLHEMWEEFLNGQTIKS